MKCIYCGFINKQDAKTCKKCGKNLIIELWKPTLKWYFKTLGIIYIILIIFYILLEIFLPKIPPPYNIRKLPLEMTPWLKK